MTAEKDINNNNDSKKLESEENYVSVAPDGGYGWVVLAASFFISFILDGIMYSFGVILQPIKAHYDATNEIANLLSCFNTGFLFCSGPIVAGLANQFGCRTVVMGGAVITSLVYFLTVFSPTIYIIMVLYGVIGGLSTGCTYIASLIIIAEYFDKKRGIATGITMAGSGVGSFVFAPLVDYLIINYDWKVAMSICACIIMQTCVCGAFLRPLNLKSKPKQVEMKKLNSVELDDENENFEKSKTMQTFSGSVLSLNADKKLPIHQRNAFLRITIGILKEMFNFKLLFQNWAFLLIAISNFFLFTGYFTPFLYITEIARNNGIDNSSIFISIIGIVNIPFRILFGIIADKRWITPVNLNTLAVLTCTIPLFFYKALQYYFWSQAIFAFFFAVGISGMNCLTTMYLVDLVGLKKFSNATGIINLFRGFGCFIGPFLSGFIADKTSTVDAFFFSGICFIIGFCLALIVSFGSMLKQCCCKDKNANEENTINNEENLLKA